MSVSNGTSGDYTWSIQIDGTSFQANLARRSTGTSHTFTVPCTFYALAKDLHLPIDQSVMILISTLVCVRTNENKAIEESAWIGEFF
jgi:hypothetical protein